jgi:hypothetical protein
MPSHSSYLLQPLDVSCFATLKRAYGRQIGQLMRDGVNHINKADFLTGYNRARTEAITPAITKSGFATIGLVPFDPDRVLSKLNIQIRTPTPTSTYTTTAMDSRDSTAPRNSRSSSKVN